MKQRIELDVTYPHPPEKVWKAITDRASLAKWLLPNDFEPRLGHRFRFRGNIYRGKRRTIRCEVVELEAPRRLAYTWRTDSACAPDVVTWTLEPVENGTRLRLEHVGPGDVSEIGLRFMASALGLSAHRDPITLLRLGDRSLHLVVGQVSYPSDNPALCIARGRTRSRRTARMKGIAHV